jgi:omega-6 fatty acid desaturase (delta-12 desaturase)
MAFSPWTAAVQLWHVYYNYRLLHDGGQYLIAKTIAPLRQPLAGLRPQSWSFAALLSVAAATAYIAAFVGAGFAPWLWLQLLCSVALGPLIALSFRIAHDCGHESHLAGRRLNRIVGRLSNLPCYHPNSVWILFHNWRHHAFTNLKDRDYLWVPLSKAEYDRRGRFGRALARFYRTSLGVGIYYLCAIWFGKMISPRRATVQKMRRVYIVDCFWVLGFLLAQLAVLAIGAAGPGAFAMRVLLAIALPFLIYCWMVGFVSFLNHTHPAVPWFARREEWSFYVGQVNCTVHMVVPRWMIFFFTDLGQHGVHHIEPRIPFRKLRRAGARIVADAGAEMVLERWTLAKHRDILRRCRLYDYDGHRWLDYDGRPTSPQLLPRLETA